MLTLLRAKYEEMLRQADDPEGTHRQDIASSTIVYLSSRMEAVSALPRLHFVE